MRYYKCKDFKTSIVYLINNLDVFFTLIGIILSTIIIYLSYFSGIAQQDFGFVCLISCIVYIITKSKFQQQDNFLIYLNKTQILILNIIFLFIFIASILLLKLNLYYRPPIYFILVSVAFATIAIEILSLQKNEYYAKLILLKIILLSLSFRVGIFYEYPSLIGTDIWGHINFARFIENYGFVPTNNVFDVSQYNFYPIFHIIIVITKLVLATNIKNALFISVSLFCIIYTIFIYIIGTIVKNNKIGLLAMLLANISDIFIVAGVTNITTGSLVLGFFLIVLYLMLKPDFRKSETQILTLLLTFSIIKTHQLTTFASIMIFIGIYLGTHIYKYIYLSRSSLKNTAIERNFTITYLILYLVLMLFYWQRTALSANSSYSFFDVMAKTFIEVIKKDIFSTPETCSYVIYYNQYNTLSNILYHPGFLILFFFSIIGFLFWFSQKEISIQKIQLISALVVSFFVIYCMPLIGFQDYLLPHRWLPFEYIFLVLMASQSLYLFIGLIKKKICFTSFVIFLIAFFMLTTPYINQDSPLYDQDRVFRSMHTSSEIQGIYSIVNMYNGTIEIDPYYRTMFIGLNFKGNIEQLDFKGVKNGNMTILRNILLYKPTQISHSGSFAQLRTAVLGHQYFSKIERSHYKIYNNGEISAYV